MIKAMMRDTSTIETTSFKAHNAYIFAHVKSRVQENPGEKKAYRVLRFGIWVSVEGMGPVN